MGISIFLKTLTIFVLKECRTDYMQGQKISASIFNRFFNNRHSYQQVCQWAKDIGMDIKFYLQLTVILSGYLAKIGVTESALSLPAYDNQ